MALFLPCSFSMTFTIGGKGRTRPNILFREVGELLQELSMRHANGEIFQNITYGNAHATNTWLAIADLRIDGDDLGVVQLW
jgi:hypothetical protein